MRKIFIQTLTELAQKDKRIVLLTADLGYTVIEPFVEKFPERFFNTGVAEQNMAGIAAGLASRGAIPFLYSISTFSTLRPYEFIRNGPIRHRLPVRIIGVGTGFEYDFGGFTHYGLEDIGILRIQPAIKIIMPADIRQARSSLLATWDDKGPVYYRLSKNDSLENPALKGDFDENRLDMLRTGKDVAIVSTGAITTQVLAAADNLEKNGIQCTVAAIACLNPAPKDDLMRLLSCHTLVVTVEAHYVTGGIGSAVCEIVAENCLKTRVIRCGIKTIPTGMTGRESAMNKRHGISSEEIEKTVRSALPVI